MGQTLFRFDSLQWTISLLPRAISVLELRDWRFLSDILVVVWYFKLE